LYDCFPHPPQITSTKVANFSPYQTDSGREKELLDYIRASPDLELMRANPTKIAEQIYLFSGTQHFLMDIGVDKADKIVDIIARVKPLVFVELGGYLGYSAIRFAQAMINALPVGSGLKVQYWSLEFNEEFAKITEVMVKLAGLSEVVKVCFDKALLDNTYINSL
jgi:catechol O-methyltransferase